MPTVVDKQTAMRAWRLRKTMTEGEKRLWRELKNFRKLYGIHVRRQAPIGPYVADFAIHSSKLLIEVDGEFHARPGRAVSDAHRDRWLREAGYRVLRFWTGELDLNVDDRIEKVLRELELTN